MNCEDKISIIVPIYKVEKYLRRCIDSIRAQTYTNLEILLIDDGSPDRCPQICDEYASKDSRVRVIHQVNGGLSAARNTGINAATGKYIGFVDSDDYIDCSMYEKLLCSIIESNADVSVCGYKMISEVGRDIEEDNDITSVDEVVQGNIILRERLLDTNSALWVVAWNKLYRKEIFDSIRYPIGKINEDEFLVHLIYANRTIAFVNYTGVFYLQRADSIMGKKNKTVAFDLTEAKLLRCEFFLNEMYDPDFVYRYFIHTFHEFTVQYSKCSGRSDIRKKVRHITSSVKRIARRLLIQSKSTKVAINCCFYAISPLITWKIKRMKLNLSKIQHAQ